MANTAERLGQAAITTSPAALFTADAVRTILKRMDVANTTEQMIRIKICIVPSGGAAGTGNTIAWNTPVAENGGTYEWEGEQVLYSGDFLSVQADYAGLTITASGVEIS